MALVWAAVSGYGLGGLGGKVEEKLLNVGRVAHLWVPHVEQAHMHRLWVVHSMSSEVTRASVFRSFCVFSQRF